MKLRNLLIILLVTTLASQNVFGAEKKQKKQPVKSQTSSQNIQKRLIDDRYEIASNIKKIDVSVHDKLLSVTPGEFINVDYHTGCGYTHNSTFIINAYRLKKDHNSYAYTLTGSVDLEGCMQSNFVNINYESENGQFYIKEKNITFSVVQTHPVISLNLNKFNKLFKNEYDDIYLVKDNRLFVKMDASADNWNKFDENVKAMLFDKGTNFKYKIKNDNVIEKWTGQDWISIMNGLPQGSINTLTIDPRNSDSIIAGTNYGIYQTTDGGFSWVKGKFNDNVDSFFINHKDNNIYYILSSSIPYVSIDSGKTWRKINDGLPTMVIKGQGRTAITKTVPVTSLVYVKSDEKPAILAFCNGYGIYRSDDNGLSWKDFNEGYDKLDGAYSVYYDDDNNELIIGAYGAIYQLGYNSTKWSKIHISNEASAGLTAINGIATDDESDGYIVSDAAGKLAYVDSNRAIGLNYGVLSHSEVSSIAIKLINNKPRLFALIRNNNYTDFDYDEQMTGGGFGTYKTLVYSDDGGITWQKPLKYKYYRDWTSSGGIGIVASPHDQNEIWLYDTGDVFASTDAGVTWNPIKNWGKNIIFDPVNNKTRYTCDNSVYKFTATDSDRVGNNVKLNVTANDVLINKSNPKMLMTDTLKISDDSGWTWRPIVLTLNKVINYNKYLPVVFDKSLILSVLTNCQDDKCESYIIKSNDLGAKWDIIKQFNGNITNVYNDAENNRLFIVYYNTAYGDSKSEQHVNRKISYTTDLGKSWKSLCVFNLKNTDDYISGIATIKHLDKDYIYIAAKSGLYLSADFGKSWVQLGGALSSTLTPTTKITESVDSSQGSIKVDKDSFMKRVVTKSEIPPLKVILRQQYIKNKLTDKYVDKIDIKAKVNIDKEGKLYLVSLDYTADRRNKFIEDSPYREALLENVKSALSLWKIDPFERDDLKISAESEIPLKVSLVVIPSIIHIKNNKELLSHNTEKHDSSTVRFSCAEMYPYLYKRDPNRNCKPEIITASLRINITIDDNGDVSDAKITSFSNSGPRRDSKEFINAVKEAAIATIKKWKFTPFEIETTKVMAYGEVDITVPIEIN